MNAIIARTNTISKDELLIKRICSTLMAFAFLAALMYGYLINKTIANVVARQHAQSEIGILSSRVAELETTQLNLKGKITANLASQLGFVEMSDPEYISAKVTSLSFNATR